MTSKAIASLDRQPASRQCSPLAPTIAAAVAAVRAHLAHRKAVVELSALDDRTLRDIGIDRSEILSVLTDRSAERIRSLPPMG